METVSFDTWSPLQVALWVRAAEVLLDAMTDGRLICVGTDYSDACLLHFSQGRTIITSVVMPLRNGGALGPQGPWSFNVV